MYGLQHEKMVTSVRKEADNNDLSSSPVRCSTQERSRYYPNLSRNEKKLSNTFYGKKLKESIQLK